MIHRPVFFLFLLKWSSLERDHRERDAIHVHIFGLETALLIEITIVHTPQPSTHHLFAKKLTAERPNTQDLCDVVRVPSLCKHRNRDDTTYVLTRLTAFANGRDYLAQRLSGVGLSFFR